MFLIRAVLNIVVRARSLVFALLMLFLWVILYTIWSGKSLQLLCYTFVVMSYELNCGDDV